jgi:predicted acylesterase/phospholipase RssA
MNIDRQRAPRIGLALSGGGFRATLFHLGVVRLLHDAGQLSAVKRIGAVSGGSILAAHLVLHWDRYVGRDEQFDEVARELIQFVQSDVRGQIVRRWILAWLLLVPRLVRTRVLHWTFTNLLQNYYSRLYNQAPLGDLHKDAPSGGTKQPEVFFYSASLTSGEMFSFDGYGFTWLDRGGTDGKHIDAPSTPLAFAVAASSAFPPLFPPIEITKDTLSTPVATFPNPHYLTDGGVYDNLGIDRLVWQQGKTKDLDLFIVSDAEGQFDSELDTGYTFIVGRNVRASDILMTRVSSLQLSNLKGPTFITVRIDQESKPPYSPLDPAIQRRCSKIRTDLDRFTPEEVTALIAHGYHCARHQLIESKRLTESSAPRFSWDPLQNWQDILSKAPEATEKLKRSSIRRWRLWSYRDWASWMSVLVVGVYSGILALVTLYTSRLFLGFSNIFTPLPAADLDYKWAPITVADWAARDLACSAGSDPVISIPGMALCDQRTAGNVAACWSGRPEAWPENVPGDCRGRADWCTYRERTVTTLALPEDIRRPTFYICVAKKN